MSKPILLIVEDEGDVRQELRNALEKRFSAHYEVIDERLPVGAVRRVEELRARKRDIALILADYHMPAMSGMEFLEKVAQFYPDARRVLLIDWLDTAANSIIARAMTLGELHYYLFKPWGNAEAQLYPTVGELLGEWFRTRRGLGWEVVSLIGDSRTREMFDLKQFLHRNNMPFKAYQPNQRKARWLLDRAGLPSHEMPVAIRFDGRTFINPSKFDLAGALAMRTQPDQGLYDVVIVGAGPAGLTAAVYAASEGLRVAMFEVEAMGGKAGTTSLIKNYLGFPRGLSGSDLARRATEQAWLFGATTVFGNNAVSLEVDGPTRILRFSDGSQVRSLTVLICTGVDYNLLSAKGIEDLVGAGVFYGTALTEANSMRGKDVFVVGGGNSAGQVATYLARQGSRVTMVIRGDSLSARMSEFLVREVEHLEEILVMKNTRVVEVHGDHYLEQVTLEDVNGLRTTHAARGLFILTGGEPNTEWLGTTLSRKDGYILTGPELMPNGKPPEDWPNATRSPFSLETSVPGVFAAGDVRYLTAKRVAVAVGDGSMAIRWVHQYLKEYYENEGESASGP